MTEEEYFTAWQTTFKDQPEITEPANLAISAGRLSTNPDPALIFIAGYQAAIRATFKEFTSNHWLAYAASEDRSETNRKPAVTISNGRLHGFKTWIAASKLVGELIVKVGSGAEARYVRVSASTTGVNITHKPASRFLPKLSQGQAEFDGAEFKELQDLSLISGFADRESYYIYLAFLSALSTQNHSSKNLSDSSSLAKRANLILQTHKGTLNNLAKLDTSIQALLHSSNPEMTDLKSAWGDDGKLFMMYSKGIQARHK